MKGVSRRVAKLFALCAVVLVLGAQPALAASRDSSTDRAPRSFLRTIIRHILDLTDIRLPPG